MWNSQLQPLAALAVPMLKRCKLSSSDGSSSCDDDDSNDDDIDSYDDSSYDDSSYDDGSSSSDSGDEGDRNLALAQKELCLGCNRFTYCTLPRKPSVPLFILRHLNVAPAAKILPKQKRHLEGWGADMIRKAGTKHNKLVQLKTYFKFRVECLFVEGVSKIFENMEVPFSLLSDCNLVALTI